MSSAPASTGGRNESPAPPGNSGSGNEAAETAVKVAGAALAVSIAVSFLRSRKVQGAMEAAVNGASAAAEDVDLKMKGARIVGEAEESSHGVLENVQGHLESVSQEGKRATSALFSRTRKAARQVKNAKREVKVETGDTLWSLSRKYCVPVDVIRISNSLSGDLILAGQDLVIPGAGLMDNGRDE